MSHRRAKRERQKHAVIATTRLPESPCPNCGKELSATTGATIGEPLELERPVPQPGTPSICWYCATLMVYDSQMRARRPTPELERRILADQPRIAELQQWVRSRTRSPNGD